MIFQGGYKDASGAARSKQEDGGAKNAMGAAVARQSSGGDVSFEQAKGIALKALKLMSDNGVPPTPSNFATWYVYAQGAAPALNAEIDRARLSGNALSPALLDELHDRFVADGGRKKEILSASERVEQAMRTLMENLGQAEAGAQAYGDSLTTLSGELSAHAEDGNVSGLQGLVAGIMQETNRMIAMNKDLEDRLGRSAQEIEKLRSDLDSVKEEAATDALTGIANRKAFDNALAEQMMASEQCGAFLSLLILDIDFFKKFNDTHGHQTGDLVLKLVAKMMVDVVGTKGLPARLGGEEFAVLLPSLPLAQAKEVAELVRGKVATKVLRNRRTGQELGTITLSIGVAEWVIGEDGTTMIERADQALYLAKRTGRNRVCTQSDLEE